MSQRRVLGEERSASQSFLNQMVREDKDKAFVIHFDSEVELLRTSLPLMRSCRPRCNHWKPRSSRGLPEAVRQAEATQIRIPGRGSGRHRGGGTTLYDSVYLASNELMQKQQGRKVGGRALRRSRHGQQGKSG